MSKPKLRQRKLKLENSEGQTADKKATKDAVKVNESGKVEEREEMVRMLVSTSRFHFLTRCADIGTQGGPCCLASPPYQLAQANSR